MTFKRQDLDELTRAVEGMTKGEWAISPVRVPGLWSVYSHDCDGPEIDAGRLGDILGIVALRNAASDLLTELQLARAVVEAARVVKDDPWDCNTCSSPPCPAECPDVMLTVALAAYQAAKVVEE